MNDSEKALAAAAKALGLPTDASIEAVLVAIKAHAALAEALKGDVKDAAPDEPESPEEAAAETPADEAKEPPMAVEPPPADAEAKAKEASLAAAVGADDGKVCIPKLSNECPSVALAEGAPAVAAAAGDPQAEEMAAGKQILDALTQATGKSPAELVAAVTDNLDAVAQALGASPQSGQPSDAAAASGEPAATPAASADATASVTLARARVEAQEATIAKLTDELNAEKTARLSREASEKKSAAEAAVEAAIKDGKALDASREKLVKFALSNPSEFADWMKSAGKVIPLGIHSAPPPPVTQASTMQLSDEQQRTYRSLIGAGISEKEARELAVDPDASKKLRMTLIKGL